MKNAKTSKARSLVTFNGVLSVVPVRIIDRCSKYYEYCVGEEDVPERLLKEMVEESYTKVSDSRKSLDVLVIPSS